MQIGIEKDGRAKVELLKSFNKQYEVVLVHEDRLICDDEVYAPSEFSEDLVLI